MSSLGVPTLEKMMATCQRNIFLEIKILFLKTLIDNDKILNASYQQFLHIVKHFGDFIYI